MKILWLTWKDKSHPLTGGAEVVNEELAKRLVRDGHEVKFIVPNFRGGDQREVRDGFEIIRVGNRLTVYWQAFKYFKKNLKGWPDLVIEEVNTIPFFSGYYTHKKTILIIYMLCRKIWFYQMPFPLSLIGYIAEPIYLRLLKHWPVITISNSTKQDLIKHGFDGKLISIIPMASEIEPLKTLNKKSLDSSVMVSLGAIRPMKRTLDQVKAFELAKDKIPNLRLLVAGEATSGYGRKVLRYIATSKYSKDIEYLGVVSKNQKVELLKESTIICVTSVKEGWGLIVTEAAGQGVPAVVYNVDGLIDSVDDGNKGVITAYNTPKALARSIEILLTDILRYSQLRNASWMYSKQLTFDRSYIELCKVL